MKVWILSQEENFHNQRMRKFHCDNFAIQRNEENLYIIYTKIDNEQRQLGIYDNADKANYALRLIKSFITYNKDENAVFTMPNNYDVVYKYAIQRYKEEKEENTKPIKLTCFEYELLKHFSSEYQIVGKYGHKKVYFKNILTNEFYALDKWGNTLFQFLNGNQLTIQTILTNYEINEEKVKL